MEDFKIRICSFCGEVAISPPFNEDDTDIKFCDGCGRTFADFLLAHGVTEVNEKTPEGLKIGDLWLNANIMPAERDKILAAIVGRTQA